MPPIVDIAALRKSFGANEVLKGIDLQVAPGEVIAIIGKSGSGKSTLLRCINGLETFESGALTVDGQLLLKNASEEISRVQLKESTWALIRQGLRTVVSALLSPTVICVRAVPVVAQSRKPSHSLIDQSKLAAW